MQITLPPECRFNGHLECVHQLGWRSQGPSLSNYDYLGPNGPFEMGERVNEWMALCVYEAR